MSFSKGRTFTVIAGCLMLSACGEGWETVEYSDRVPYMMERTAGSGVEYVRAQMMPEKEFNLTPATELEKELSGSKVKGYKPRPEPRTVPGPQAQADLTGADVQEIQPAAGEEGPMIESQPSDTYTQFQGYPPNGNPPPPIIATASPQDLPAQNSQSHEFQGYPLDDPSEAQAEAVVSDSAESVSQSVDEDQIVVPKREHVEPVSEGEKQLNAIYFNDPYEE